MSYIDRHLELWQVHRVRVPISAPAVMLQGTPDQTLSAQQLPGHMRGVRPAAGFTDIQFLSGGQYGMAAACASGQVSFIALYAPISPP